MTPNATRAILLVLLGVTFFLARLATERFVSILGYSLLLTVVTYMYFVNIETQQLLQTHIKKIPGVTIEFNSLMLAITTARYYNIGFTYRTVFFNPVLTYHNPEPLKSMKDIVVNERRYKLTNIKNGTKITKHNGFETTDTLPILKELTQRTKHYSEEGTPGRPNKIVPHEKI